MSNAAEIYTGRNDTGKKQTAAYVITSFIFNFYLIGILTLTGICLRGSFSPRIVFIPFVDMIKGPKDTILNVLLFIPLGCFLPLLYEQYDSIGKIAFMGFLVSLSVEIVQMFGYGATDINDLITNTIGACLGFFIFTILYRMIPRSWLKLIRVEGTQCYYEPLFFWIALILVMLTVQIYIFHEFFLQRWVAVKYRNGNSIDSGLSIENRGVHIPAKWKTNIWTIDDHGFSPACMKQKCFRTSRAFYLVSVIL